MERRQLKLVDQNVGLPLNELEWGGRNNKF